MSYLTNPWEEFQERAEREMGIVHRDGIPWGKAPRPRRWHRCQTWTSGMVYGLLVRRCACGAMSTDGRHWSERNNRLKEEDET